MSQDLGFKGIVSVIVYIPCMVSLSNHHIFHFSQQQDTPTSMGLDLPSTRTWKNFTIFIHNNRESRVETSHTMGDRLLSPCP
jgi:hypothetical protein